MEYICSVNVFSSSLYNKTQLNVCETLGKKQTLSNILSELYHLSSMELAETTSIQDKTLNYTK
jgi:hypothetical protein